MTTTDDTTGDQGRASGATPGDDAAAPAPAARRRAPRRAASRPAGPPAPPPAEPAAQAGPPADEAPLAEPVTAVEVAPAPRAAEQEPADQPAPALDQAPPERAEQGPREPAPVTPAVDATAVDATAEATAPAGEGDDAAEPTAAPRRQRRRVVSPVFQAADPTQAPRRHRAASRPAGPPQHVETAEPTSARTSAPAPTAPGADEGATRPAADAPLARFTQVSQLDQVRAGSSRRPGGAVDDADEVPAAGGVELPAPDDEADEPATDETRVADPVEEPPLGDSSDEEPDDAGDDDEAPEDGADDEARARRPRRRRGGRGRRRREPDEAGEAAAADSDATAEDTGGGADADERAPGDRQRPDRAAAPTTDEVDDEGDDGEDGDAGDDRGDAAEGDQPEGDGSSRRRRRRRRGRSGEASSGGDSPSEEEGESEGASPSSTRSRSRARRAADAVDDVTAVRGSTRLEAKRQRRRDGRDGGRRRQAITEAEFLARRESVERTMVVRSAAGRAQVAVLEDGVLVEHYVARKQHTSMIGNVHLGRVQNVLPSMEAAFVDIGRGRNAVLYAGEVDWTAAGLTGSAKRIEAALKPGDPVLVQVTKDPIGHKGSRLTSQISLPGRYLVYVPNGSMTGISRKLPDTERARLKAILKAVVPEHAGVIVRTAAEGASETELRRDVERLAAQWEEISARAKRVSPPTLLHGEPDLVVKVVRDVFNEDFTSLVVVGDEAWTTVKGYVDSVAPDLSSRVSRWDGPGDAFGFHRIDEQIAKALERKVWLPSGGSLVIDRTEAMTVVDVNTGRFTGAGGNLEETVTKNNLEAAEEIVRQLRLRDIGGIIVVDFIDMVLESNRELVLRRLVECLGRDRTKHQVAEVTSLGLVQMTRKRVGQGLIEAYSDPCEHCAGRGVVVHPELFAAESGAAASGAGATGAGAAHDHQHEDAVVPAAAPATSEPPRSREDAARDAVRDAMRGVAEAARLHRSSDEPAAVSIEDVVEEVAAAHAADLAAEGGALEAVEVVEVVAVETVEVVEAGVEELAGTAVVEAVEVEVAAEEVTTREGAGVAEAVVEVADVEDGGAASAAEPGGTAARSAAEERAEAARAVAALVGDAIAAAERRA